MHTKNISVIAITSVALALAGCATELPGGQKPDSGNIAKSAGVGCLVGGGLGYLMGGAGLAKKGCVAGALVGGVSAYEAQMKQAREAADAAKAAGWRADVRSHQVTENGKQTEAFDGLTIDYDAGSMAAMGPKTVATMDKLAAILSASKNKLTVTFDGRKSCEVPLIALNNRGALAKHTVADRCGQLAVSRITVSPMPRIGA